MYNSQRVKDEPDHLSKFVNKRGINYSKDSFPVKSMIDNSLFRYEGNSFDRDELLRHKLIKKNIGLAKKGDIKIQVSSQNNSILGKKSGTKFMMYKRPDVNMDNSLYRKGSYQVDKKMHSKVVTTQNKKHKRSATPSLTGVQQYVYQQYATHHPKRKV
jgi:hypothetical protein